MNQMYHILLIPKLYYFTKNTPNRNNIEKYKVTPQPVQVYTPVVIIIHPTGKVYHNFDVDYNYLIQYTVNFRGFYCCGSTDHYRTRDWSIASSKAFVSRHYSKNCGILKPSFKKTSVMIRGSDEGKKSSQ